jgi:hypothetical protein
MSIEVVQRLSEPASFPTGVTAVLTMVVQALLARGARHRPAVPLPSWSSASGKNDRFTWRPRIEEIPKQATMRRLLRSRAVAPRSSCPAARFERLIFADKNRFNHP